MNVRCFPPLPQFTLGVLVWVYLSLYLGIMDPSLEIKRVTDILKKVGNGCLYKRKRLILLSLPMLGPTA